MTRREILAAALSILESDSAETVTMARVAGMLGTSPMSLYVHVSDREDMLLGACGLALEDFAFDPAEHAGDEWDRAIRAWMEAVHEVLARYPHATTFAYSHGHLDAAFWTKASLGLAGILRDLRLEGPDMVEAIRWVVRTTVAMSVLHVVAPPPGPALALLGNAGSLAEKDRARFALSIGSIVKVPPRAALEFGWERIVDGLRALEQRAAEAG